VDKKGVVTYTVVEDFDKSFYDEAELQGEIEEDIQNYNKNFAADHLTLKKFQVEDGVASLQLKFDEVRYYADYSGQVLFQGSIEDAQAAGYEVSGECLDTEGSLTDVDSIAGGSKAKVIVTNEAVQVEVPGKILCVSSSGNVEITGKKTAAVQEEGQTAFIIYE
jgi:hypothetical protein